MHRKNLTSDNKLLDKPNIQTKIRNNYNCSPDKYQISVVSHPTQNNKVSDKV